MWACATAGHTNPAFFDAVAEAAAARAFQLSPQELSNTCWSFATLDHKVPHGLEGRACVLCAAPLFSVWCSFLVLLIDPRFEPV